MKKHIALLLGGAELLAAAAVGLTVRAAPASAAPTQSGANLFNTQSLADPGQLLVSVQGLFPINGYDAHGSSTTSMPVRTSVARGTRSSATTTAQTTVRD